MKALLVVAAFGHPPLPARVGSSNTALFARHYPWLIGLNAIVALSLLSMVAWRCANWREHRQKVFGSRLKLRLMAIFGLMAVLPGILIYGVSVRFLTKSIESWFDVRVERRSNRAGARPQRARRTACRTDGQGAGRRTRARRLPGKPAAGLAQPPTRAGRLGYRPSSPFPATAGQCHQGLAILNPPQPSSTAQLQQARVGRTARSRAMVSSMCARAGAGGDARPRHRAATAAVHAWVPVAWRRTPRRSRTSIATIRSCRWPRGLTQIYALTLTLTVLLALFAALRWPS